MQMMEMLLASKRVKGRALISLGEALKREQALLSEVSFQLAS